MQFLVSVLIARYIIANEGAGSRLSDLMESCDQIVRLLLAQSRGSFDRVSYVQCA